MTHRRPRLSLLLLLWLAATSCDGDGSPAGLAPAATTIELSAASVTLTALGDTVRLMATVKDQSGAEMPGAPLTWTSTAPQTASISPTGLVTALAAGPATITVTSGAAAASAAVSVTQRPAALVLSPSVLDLAGPGDTVTVSATVSDAGGHAIPNADLDWLSDDEGVATVSSSGLVTAVASGSAAISAELAVDGDLLSEAVEAVVGSGVLADPAGGQVSAAGGSVELQVPPGALTGRVFITADPAQGLPAGAAPIPGTAFDLGPDGLAFGQPVTLTISYDPSDVPAGVAEEDLALYKLVNGKYEPVDGSAVDAAGNSVSGTIDGFSIYAVVRALRVTTSSLPDAVQSADYGSHVLAVSGGTSGSSWSVISGALPPGLTLASDGVVSGTPTAAGTFPFTLQVQSGPLTAHQALSITVVPPLVISTATLPSGATAVAYGASLAAVGGTGSYAWAIAAGALPSGLVLDPATGSIAGTPNAVGAFGFTAQATSGGQTTARSLSISIHAPLQITTASLPNGVSAQPYSTTLAATGGSGGYTWSLAAGSLPPGLTISAGGVISGSPSAVGGSSFTVQATSGDGQTTERALSITVTDVLSILTAALPSVVEGVPYAETLVATGGTGSYTWTVVSGSLPTGLELSATGVITGTPSVPGASDFVVEVTDGTQSAQRTLSITVIAVLSVTTSSLPDGLEADEYDAVLNATGGVGSYSWSLQSGSLPAGLTLDPTGVIAGTPTVRGTSDFTVRVVSGTQSAQQLLSITVLGVPATVTDLALVGRTATTLTVRFTEVDDGGGAPADYAIRRAVSPIEWGDAQDGQTIVGGAQVGAAREVTIDIPGGLVSYDVRMVAFRGTLDVDAVLSELSNIATAPVLQPAELCSAHPGYAIATFADGVLSGLVATALGVNPGGVTCTLAAGLTVLSDGEQHPTALVGIQNLTGLTNLALGSQSGFWGPTDLSPLSGLPSLRLLTLSGMTLPGDPSPPIDIGPLAGLTNLESLTVYHARSVKDLSALSGLTKLTRLHLHRLGTGDISPLSGMTALTELSVVEVAVPDLGPLAGLTNLTLLQLYDTGRGDDLGPLVGLTNLETLNLKLNPGLQDIQPLLDNPGLAAGDHVSLFSTSVLCNDVAALEAKGVNVEATCLRITTTSLDEGVVGAPYAATLTQSGLPNPDPPVWALAGASGPLPPGLALSTDGVISGTPTETGTWAFTVEVADPPGGPWLRSADKDLSITVLAEPACTLATPGDADGDRLPDCAETNTGTFVNELDTGTDPNDPDTDGDSIRDGDEVLGTLAGLDLPGLGVNPLVPSILIEYDWFDDSGHTHRPTPTQIAMVTASFAAQGIEVIHDYGQGPAPFDGGNFIADADGNVDGFGPEYHGYKAVHFAANRHGFFHYNLHPHRYNNGSSSGLAEINGDDLITATLNFYTNNLAVAGTIQHELGHNLNLLHGGNVNTNYKPNYNSVMSYSYQFGGVDNDCTPPPNGVLDYSHGLRPPLNENDLDETLGICGGPPGWDWNQDGDALDSNVVADINPAGVGDGLFSVLHDHDDWTHLSFTGIGDFDGAALRAPPEIVACPEPPPELSPPD